MPRPLFILGASGFVGRHLVAALGDRPLRCGSRQPEPARSRAPGADWVRCDLDDPDSLERALDDCGVAFFLAHRMGGDDRYAERERESAMAFTKAAAHAGVERIVYLGGVAPHGTGSRHLASRLQTGEILRSGPVPCTELRSAMIIGHGSASWLIIRDLARRLPAMVLPQWLENHAWPVGIDDVVRALVGSLALPARSSCLELPGPERVSHRTLLRRAGRILNGRPPWQVYVPVLSPRMTSRWIQWVTRADPAIVRVLIEGLVEDLDPRGDSAWEALGDEPRVGLDEAMERAVRMEEADASLPWLQRGLRRTAIRLGRQRVTTP